MLNCWSSDEVLFPKLSNLFRDPIRDQGKEIMLRFERKKTISRQSFQPSCTQIQAVLVDIFLNFELTSRPFKIMHPEEQFQFTLKLAGTNEAKWFLQIPQETTVAEFKTQERGHYQQKQHKVLCWKCEKWIVFLSRLDLKLIFR